MRDTVLASQYINNFKNLKESNNKRWKKKKNPKTAFMKHNPRYEPLLMYYFQKKYITLNVKKAMILCISNKKGRIQKEVKRKSKEGKTVFDLKLEPELRNFLEIAVEEDEELGIRC